MDVDISISDESNSDKTDKKPVVGIRWILIIIIFVNLSFVFFIRNCLSVAIVAMVNSNSTSEDQEEVSSDVCQAANASQTSDSDSTDGEYYWTNAEQGLVLGAYFWGFVPSRLLLSRIAETFGSRRSMIVGLIIAGILTLLSPVCAEISPYLMAANRFLLGICFGPHPAIYQCLFAAWAPKSELGIMTTLGYSGSSVGGMLSLVFSGWLSENLGWRSIFYFAGTFLLLLPPLWIFLVRNNPSEHPMLSDYEKKILIDNMKIKTQKSVPWKKIIFSPYVLLAMFCLFAREWIMVLQSIEGPTFLSKKIGLDLDTASYVNGGSTLMSLVSSLIFGIASDYLINKNYLSITNSRKLFHFIGTGIPPVILLGVILSSCNKNAVIALWIILGFFVNGTMLSVVLSTIDLAPAQTAAVNGLMALSTLAGSIEPLVTSLFVESGNGWDKTFYLTIGLTILSCVLYILFMTADPQPWNFSEDEKNDFIKAIENVQTVDRAGAKNSISF